MQKGKEKKERKEVKKAAKELRLATKSVKRVEKKLETKPTPPGQGKRATQRRKKQPVQHDRSMIAAVGSHFYPLEFPAVPTTDRYASDWYSVTDFATVGDGLFTQVSLLNIFQRAMMIVGHTNPHYAGVAYIGGNTLDTRNNYAQDAPNFGVRVETQTPSLQTIDTMKLHTISITVNLPNQRITDPGYMLFGLIPEAIGTAATAEGQEGTYVSEASAREFTLANLLAMRHTKQIPLSQLVGKPLKIVGHALSPRAEALKDPNSMVLTALTKEEFSYLKTVDPKRLRPQASKLLNEYSRDPKKQFITRVGEPIADTIGYWLVDDYMVPFVAYVPLAPGTATDMLPAPFIRIERSWLGTRSIRPPPAPNGSLGDFLEPLPQLAQAIKTYMPEVTRRFINTVSDAHPIVPAQIGDMSTETLIQNIIHVGQKGIEWAQTPEGKRVLKTSAEILGFGASVALKSIAL